MLLSQCHNVQRPSVGSKPSCQWKDMQPFSSTSGNIHVDGIDWKQRPLCYQGALQKAHLDLKAESELVPPSPPPLPSPPPPQFYYQINAVKAECKLMEVQMFLSAFPPIMCRADRGSWVDYNILLTYPQLLLVLATQLLNFLSGKWVEVKKRNLEEMNAKAQPQYHVNW